jgi:tRNA U34 5-methylaminomethyl-2-thiouridine-forming methyltransferase MnmC
MATEDKSNVTETPFGQLVLTADGSWTIRHQDHGQDFHSSEGACFEAWQLYVRSSGLVEALAPLQLDHLNVLDVGMGLAYNAAATIAAWLDAGSNAPDLSMLSLEIDARLVKVLATGRAPWVAGWDPRWLSGLQNLRQVNDNRWLARMVHPLSRRICSWWVSIGDASQNDLQAALEAAAMSRIDFVWQDPFTPDLNPTMWSPEWFRKVADVSSSRAVLMSYSVARPVKDALREGGWCPERFRTPGKKRHWLRARRLAAV